MKTRLEDKFIRRVEYAGYIISLYPKRNTDKAVEFFIFDPKMKLSNETIWIPKSSISNRMGESDYYGLNWLFKKSENQEKLRKIGYVLF